MKTTSSLWLLALVSGALIPVQAAPDAALSRSIHDNVPFAAMLLFAVGAVATAIAVLVAGAPVPNAMELRAAPWWSYSGGLIVAFYVFAITYLAPRLGGCHHPPGARSRETRGVQCEIFLPQTCT